MLEKGVASGSRIIFFSLSIRYLGIDVSGNLAVLIQIVSASVLFSTLGIDNLIIRNIVKNKLSRVQSFRLFSFIRSSGCLVWMIVFSIIYRFTPTMAEQGFIVLLLTVSLYSFLYVYQTDDVYLIANGKSHYVSIYKIVVGVLLFPFQLFAIVKNLFPIAWYPLIIFSSDIVYYLFVAFFRHKILLSKAWRKTTDIELSGVTPLFLGAVLSFMTNKFDAVILTVFGVSSSIISTIAYVQSCLDIGNMMALSVIQVFSRNLASNSVPGFLPKLFTAISIVSIVLCILSIMILSVLSRLHIETYTIALLCIASVFSAIGCVNGFRMLMRGLYWHVQLSALVALLGKYLGYALNSNTYSVNANGYVACLLLQALLFVVCLHPLQRKAIKIA